LDQERLHDDLEKLREIAKQVLHGRNATIFEKMVIKPLEDGVRHPPVEDVAAQLNVVKPKRAYKILAKCWDKISKARARFEAGEPLMEEKRSSVCSECGRPDSSNTMCPRGNDGACGRRHPYRGRGPSQQDIQRQATLSLRAPFPETRSPGD